MIMTRYYQNHSNEKYKREKEKFNQIFIITYFSIIGISIKDAWLVFLDIVIIGEPSVGIRTKVSLSAPAIAIRILCPFRISTDVGIKPKDISDICPGTSGEASFFSNVW